MSSRKRRAITPHILAALAMHESLTLHDIGQQAPLGTHVRSVEEALKRLRSNGHVVRLPTGEWMLTIVARATGVPVPDTTEPAEVTP